MQGISDSYTRIRNHGGVPEALVRNSSANLKERAENWLRSIRKNNPFGRQYKQHRVDLAYQDGIAFHENEVRNDPKLLQWILKDDYWDYSYPL